MGVTVTGTVISVVERELPIEVQEALRALFGHHLEIRNLPPAAFSVWAIMAWSKPLAVVFFIPDQRARALFDAAQGNPPVLVPDYRYVDEDEGSPQVFVGTFSEIIGFADTPQLVFFSRSSYMPYKWRSE